MSDPPKHASEDERCNRDDGDAEAEHPDLVEAAVVVAPPVQPERQPDQSLQHDGDDDGGERHRPR